MFPAAVNKGIAAAIQKSNTNKSTAYAIDKASKIEFELDNLKPSKEGNWENFKTDIAKYKIKIKLLVILILLLKETFLEEQACLHQQH